LLVGIGHPIDIQGEHEARVSDGSLASAFLRHVA